MLPSPPYHPDAARLFWELEQKRHEWRALLAIEISVDNALTASVLYRYAVLDAINGLISTYTPFSSQSDVVIVPIQSTERRATHGFRLARTVSLTTVSGRRTTSEAPDPGLDGLPQFRDDLLDATHGLAPTANDRDFVLIELGSELLHAAPTVDVQRQLSPTPLGISGAVNRTRRRFQIGADLQLPLPDPLPGAPGSPPVRVQFPAEMMSRNFELLLGVPGPAETVKDLALQLDALATQLGNAAGSAPVAERYVWYQARQLLGSPTAPQAPLRYLVAGLENLKSDAEVLESELGVEAKNGYLGYRTAINDVVNSLATIARTEPTGKDLGRHVNNATDGLRRASQNVVWKISCSVHDDPSGSVGAVVEVPALRAVRPLGVVVAYSHSQVREVGMRVALSLWSVGLVLLGILTRFVLNLRWGVVPDGLTLARLDEHLAASSAALVVILVFFPTILFTQVDRVGRRDLIEARATEAALAFFFVGLLVPILCAIALVGNVRAPLTLALIGVGGGTLMVLGTNAFRTFSRSRLARVLSTRSAQVADEFAQSLRGG